MEKSFKINIPEGFEIDEEKSSFKEIVFKPIAAKVVSSYEEVAKELFAHKPCFFLDISGDIQEATDCLDYKAPELNNCTSSRQAQKLLAINKMFNIAVYANKMFPESLIGWEETYWFLGPEGIEYVSSLKYCTGLEVFTSKEAAEFALTILTPEEVKLITSIEF